MNQLKQDTLMAISQRNKISVNFSSVGMTDVVFNLLIFFMLTSTLVHPTALKLLLPKGRFTDICQTSDNCFDNQRPEDFMLNSSLLQHRASLEAALKTEARKCT